MGREIMKVSKVADILARAADMGGYGDVAAGLSEYRDRMVQSEALSERALRIANEGDDFLLRNVIERMDKGMWERYLVEVQAQLDRMRNSLGGKGVSDREIAEIQDSLQKLQAFFERAKSRREGPPVAPMMEDEAPPAKKKRAPAKKKAPAKESSLLQGDVHDLGQERSIQKHLNYTLREMEAMPTLSTGQADDLKVDTGD
ncbi:MAG: hypothetical protein Q8P59_13135, partial [Dehalococcoidia bacterium]|nr:hypothetical protein [Dehalococcoidia bacterium]